MTSATTSVSNLDIGTLAQDAVSRGYTKSSWYLIDVEAGFELWQGGAGLATNSFSVSVGGGSSSPTPTTPTSSSRRRRPRQRHANSDDVRPGACSGTYSVTSSWQGGFQGRSRQEHRPGTLNGRQLHWTFPGSQVINSPGMALYAVRYQRDGDERSYDGSRGPWGHRDGRLHRHGQQRLAVKRDLHLTRAIRAVRGADIVGTSHGMSRQDGRHWTAPSGAAKNVVMDWPFRFPVEMSAGAVSVCSYDSDDAAELFDSLRDERAWEHIPMAIPADAASLDASIRSRLADGHRATFTVRQGGRVVGTTSVIFHPADPAGVEVGGTQLDPGVWGTEVNTEVKRLLFEVIFRHGAEWIQLRTDERNGRSAAAIRKLGAAELGVRQDDLVRRDGTRRRSRFFRVART